MIAGDEAGDLRITGNRRPLKRDHHELTDALLDGQARKQAVDLRIEWIGRGSMIGYSGQTENQEQRCQQGQQRSTR